MSPFLRVSHEFMRELKRPSLINGLPLLAANLDRQRPVRDGEEAILSLGIGPHDTLTAVCESYVDPLVRGRRPRTCQGAYDHSLAGPKAAGRRNRDEGKGAEERVEVNVDDVVVTDRAGFQFYGGLLAAAGRRYRLRLVVLLHGRAHRKAECNSFEDRCRRNRSA